MQRFLAALGQVVVELLRGLAVGVDALAQLGRVELLAQFFPVTGQVLARGLGALVELGADLVDRVQQGLRRDVAGPERGEQRGAGLLGGLAQGVRGLFAHLGHVFGLRESRHGSHSSGCWVSPSTAVSCSRRNEA